jgi:APA family basic amino acid/polyamine antiporter
MQTDLKRSLSLPLVTFYGIGTILGAGIYVLVGKVAGYAGMFTPLAFLVASLLAALSAFSYAELSARFPKSAGEAVYVQEGLGWRHLSIVVGVAIVLSGTISMATLVHGFVGYFQVFFNVPAELVIIFLTLVLGLVVAWGINESVIIASLMTLLEIGGLVLILWVGHPHLADLPARWPDMLPPLELSAWAGIMAGSFIAFYAFIGFEDIVNVAEEVRNPHRNLPRAIVIALIVTTLFYFAVAIVSILTLTPEQLSRTDAPLAELYWSVTGREPIVITIISLVSVLNGALIQIIMASRVLYGMSRQGWLPPFLGQVNVVTRTPLAATGIITALVLLFALWLPLVSLAKLTSFIILIVFALINLSLWQIKIRAPQPEDIRAVPLWVPIIGFFFSGAFVFYQLIMFFVTDQ